MSAAEGNDPLQGLLLIRLASASERDGDWVAAASLYEQAGRLPGYPAAAQALADAARSYAAANDAARAIALYDESVERAGKPGAPHIRSLIEDLRATQGP
jgi:tetratricopeptide (TPR) repeat protein